MIAYRVINWFQRLKLNEIRLLSNNFNVIKARFDNYWMKIQSKLNFYWIIADLQRY